MSKITNEDRNDIQELNEAILQMKVYEAEVISIEE